MDIPGGGDEFHLLARSLEVRPSTHDKEGLAMVRFAVADQDAPLRVSQADTGSVEPPSITEGPDRPGRARVR